MPQKCHTELGTLIKFNTFIVWLLNKPILFCFLLELTSIRWLATFSCFYCFYVSCMFYCYCIICVLMCVCLILIKITYLLTPWTYFLHLSLSFWLTLPRGVLSTSWCCPSRPCVVFLACVHLALFLALSLSPDNSLVSSWCDHSMLVSLLWQYLTVPSLLQLC